MPSMGTGTSNQEVSKSRLFFPTWFLSQVLSHCRYQIANTRRWGLKTLGSHTPWSSMALTLLFKYIKFKFISQLGLRTNDQDVISVSSYGQTPKTNKELGWDSRWTVSDSKAKIPPPDHKILATSLIFIRLGKWQLFRKAGFVIYVCKIQSYVLYNITQTEHSHVSVSPWGSHSRIQGYIKGKHHLEFTSAPL